MKCLENCSYSTTVTKQNKKKVQHNILFTWCIFRQQRIFDSMVFLLWLDFIAGVALVKRLIHLMSIHFYLVTHSGLVDRETEEELREKLASFKVKWDGIEKKFLQHEESPKFYDYITSKVPKIYMFCCTLLGWGLGWWVKGHILRSHKVSRFTNPWDISAIFF